jgi:hypothetical protein
MIISKGLSAKIANITNAEDLDQWIKDAEKEIKGSCWLPVGGIDNNAHVCEVSTDAGLALIEIITNGIDALLDMMAEILGQTAKSPHEAATKWFDIPSEGPGFMKKADRIKVARLIDASMWDSGIADSPTVVVTDKGIGVHPDQFKQTILSIGGSTKIGKMHQMGMYNAGGKASYKFASRTVIISRRKPSLLGKKMEDEVGLAIVKYDEQPGCKIGHYTYMTDRNGDIVRLNLPNFNHGTQVRLVEYRMKNYSGRINHPAKSLWQLCHSSLVNPALPVTITENRLKHLKLKKADRRTVSGLMHQLSLPDVTAYSEKRSISLGKEGKILLNYYVLADDATDQYYVKAEQGITISLNGQRQIIKDRRWFKDKLGLYFLFKKLIVLVDGTGLTQDARRQVFASTREGGVDSSETTERIMKIIEEELKSDEMLYALEEEANQKTKQSATESANNKVKERLSSQISAYLSGIGGVRTSGCGGNSSGSNKKRNIDDSHLPLVPTMIKIENSPLEVCPGKNASLKISLDAKNGYLPDDSREIKVVFAGKSAEIISTGTLLGGQMRLTLKCNDAAAAGSYNFTAILTDANLGLLLSDNGILDVVLPAEKKPSNKSEKGGCGGDFDISINWHSEENWPVMEWDANSVGACRIYRDDPKDNNAITKLEFDLNKDYGSYQKIIGAKRLTEKTTKEFNERYQMPICLGLFHIAMEKEGVAPEDYVKREQNRMAQVLLAGMEPDLRISMEMDLDSAPEMTKNKKAIPKPMREDSNATPQRGRLPSRLEDMMQAEMEAASEYRKNKKTVPPCLMD